MYENYTSSKDSLEKETICQFFDFLEEENDFESDLYEDDFEEEKKLFDHKSNRSKSIDENPISRILLRQSNLFKHQIFSPPDVSI